MSTLFDFIILLGFDIKYFFFNFISKTYSILELLNASEKHWTCSLKLKASFIHLKPVNPRSQQKMTNIKHLENNLFNM